MLEIFTNEKILKERSHVLERKWIYSNILTIFLLCLYFSNQSKFPLFKGESACTQGFTPRVGPFLWCLPVRIQIVSAWKRSGFDFNTIIKVCLFPCCFKCCIKVSPPAIVGSRILSTVYFHLMNVGPVLTLLNPYSSSARTVIYSASDKEILKLNY